MAVGFLHTSAHFSGLEVWLIIMAILLVTDHTLVSISVTGFGVPMLLLSSRYDAFLNILVKPDNQEIKSMKALYALIVHQKLGNTWYQYPSKAYRMKSKRTTNDRWVPTLSGPCRSPFELQSHDGLGPYWRRAHKPARKHESKQSYAAHP